jgi:hypothetical protein
MLQARSSPIREELGQIQKPIQSILTMTHPPINSRLRTQIISIPIESISLSQGQGRKVEAGAQDSDGEAASSRKRGPQWRCAVESRARAWGSDGEAAPSHELGP